MPVNWYMKHKDITQTSDKCQMKCACSLYSFFKKLMKLMVKEGKNALEKMNELFDKLLEIRSLAAKFAEPHLKEKFGEDFDYVKVRNRRKEMMSGILETNGIEKK